MPRSLSAGFPENLPANPFLPKVGRNGLSWLSHLCTFRREEFFVYTDRYLYGSLRLKQRQKGVDVWDFRYYVQDKTGTPVPTVASQDGDEGNHPAHFFGSLSTPRHPLSKQHRQMQRSADRGF